MDLLLETKDPERLYEFQGSKYPPVDVVGLAGKLGIQRDTSFDPGRFGYSGEIYWDATGIARVWINPADSEVRQRFTWAHEIGHFILHMQNDKSVRFKDDVKVMRRGAGWDFQEMEANRFAAKLLMPRQLLEIEIRKLGGLALKSSLARTFKVSEESMGFRLSKLNI